ncbi:thioredoxin family protein [[Mycoplasma] falconis]|uniref:Thioredoxin family protein n=1 Tax=[Mycoplasma] falconis TaxID=92403 RepID=A0A501X8N4_9BACT|nr:thioredoxin family protein [[Mycoplasma] falconis]TPE56764.1 thioredoxin family protein [[Mycoplasma] falconis]
MYIKTTKQELENKHLNDKKAILAFRAVWCPPCQMLGPELERLGEENDEINIYDIDVDQDTAFAREMNVTSIPSLFYFADGKQVNHSVGYMPAEELLKKF